LRRFSLVGTPALLHLVKQKARPVADSLLGSVIW
jgi:hypothetical protein